MLTGMGRLRYPGSDVGQLLLAPQDLRTADPSFSTEIYSGHFGLAGTYALLDERSPFQIRPPSAAWAQELHGFGWLRHLRAADSDLARHQAQTLLADWAKLHHPVSSIAWRPDIAGRRVISWLSNSVVVLDTEDPQSYQTFMHELTAQLRYLSASYRGAPDGLPRLVAAIGLIYGGLCIAGQQAVVNRYLKWLTRELDRQVLADGGHISRNPADLIELLLDLLPLRQCFMARDREPPQALTDAIGRALQGLRFFRFRDGTLARFNGAGVTPMDSLATVLAYDDAETAPPPATAPNSAYARLARNGTLMICDFGAPPSLALSTRAGAGCLAFELSSGPEPIVVNCGTPSPDHVEWDEFARSTQAYSTLSIDGISSGMFHGYDDLATAEAEVQLSGPPKPEGEVKDADERFEFIGSHEGYVARFGLRHSRQMLMAPTGHVITGKDVLTPVKGGKNGRTAERFAIRFHLHPRIEAVLSDDRHSVLLTLANGEMWRLNSNAASTALEESMFFGDERGPQDSLQAVLSGPIKPGEELRIVWALERIQAATGGETLKAPPPAEAA
jgi:uncharacterized heparinase superfamily protein